MTLRNRAREAAIWFFDYHVSTLAKAPTEWVVRSRMALFSDYLHTHPYEPETSR